MEKKEERLELSQIEYYIIMCFLFVPVIVGLYVVINGNRVNEIKERFLPQEEILNLYVKNEQKYKYNQLPDAISITNHFKGLLKVSDITQNGYSLTYTKIPTGDYCVDFISNQKAYFDSFNGISYFDSSQLNQIKSICNNGQDNVGVTFKLIRGEVK